MPPQKGNLRWMDDLCVVLFAINLLLFVLFASFLAVDLAHHLPGSPASFLARLYLVWLIPYSASFLLCARNFAQPGGRWWITLIPPLMMIPDEVFVVVLSGISQPAEGKDLTMMLMVILITPPKILLTVVFARAARLQFKLLRGPETSAASFAGQR